MAENQSLLMLKLPEGWSWKENYTWILLTVFLLISFQLKISALDRYIAPPGCDPGNYLFAVSAFQGNDIAGFGPRYPPIFYLLFSLTLKLFGEFTALKVTAGVVSTIIGIPFFILVRRLSDDLISLVCTMFFVFFFEYFGIPAWGGYGNLLGIFFVLFFLLFLSKAARKTSISNLLFTALFFSLVLGTHVLVLLFAVLTTIVFLMLIFALHIRNTPLRRLYTRFKPSLICGVISFIFSLPFVPFYYLMFQDYPFSTPAYLSLDLLRFISSFGGVVYSCGAVVFFLFFFFYFFYKKETHNEMTHVLIAALFLCPFMLSFAVPTLFSKVIRRVPIFWSIPILLSTAILLKFAKRHLKKFLFYLLVLSLIVASVLWFIPKSVNHLYGAVDYYQVIKKDELAALSWIKNNTKRSDNILCSGSSPNRKLGWWVQGWAKRKAFSTEEAYWYKDYTFRREREEAEIASRILSEGDYILENGLVRVADYSFQKNVTNNPIIAVKDIGKYQNLIFANDSSVNLNFSTLSNPQKAHTFSPLYSQNKSIYINQTQEYGRFEYLFRGEQTTIKRLVILERDTNYVDIGYEVNLINATTNRFEVRIWPYLEFAHCEILANSSLILAQIIEGKPVYSKISLTLENAECIHYGLGPQNRSHYVSYAFTSRSITFHIKIRISFTSLKAQQIEPVEYYNIAELLKQHNIGYILIDKSHQRRYMWLRESGHFGRVFDTQIVSIFAVDKEGKKR